MIDSIHGRLVTKDPTHAVLEVGGIRLRIQVTLTTFESLPAMGNEAELLTYLHVREDILDLYGFHSPEERNLFLLLNTISGIGPRLAITILSGTNPQAFKERIINGDVRALTIIPGIGTKTAKRIIVELKEKFVDTEEEDLGFISSEHLDAAREVTQALLSLGYTRRRINPVVKDLEKGGDFSDSLEGMIKKALAKLV